MARLIPEAEQYGIVGLAWKLWSARWLFVLTTLVVLLALADAFFDFLPRYWYVVIIVVGNFGVFALRVLKQDHLEKFE